MGNSVLIEQVLLNLCINARDAINGSGTIEIGTQLCNNLDINCVSCREKLTGNFVEISVKDSGEGIDTALITRIFDPFFSTKERTKGTGMGLSIVHGIVHELRGHILVESNLGHGTTFRILFPKATGGIQPVKNTGHHQRQSIGTPRIMVVDDNESQAHLIQEILKSSAYEVMVFNDSVEAIDYFTEQPHTIDLIVTDQIMPKMRGTELAEKALQISPNLPIIMCTAYSENVSEIVAKSLGFAGYIPKPINIRNLRNMIEELV